METDLTACGPHRYRLEGDVILWVPHGVVEIEHARVLARLVAEQANQYGYALMLSNGQELESISAEARRHYIEELRRVAVDLVIASFGASLLAGTAQTFINRSASLLARLPITLRHFATEGAAREFLRSESQRRAASPTR